MEEMNIPAEVYGREIHNINQSLSVLADKGVDLGPIRDGIVSFNELLHNEAVGFYLLCKYANCFQRVWKSIKTKSGKRFTNRFFIGVETSHGPIVLTLAMDDFDMFDDIQTLDFSPYEDGLYPYTADKINDLRV